MATEDLMFTEQEMRVDQGLGYPIAYSKLCKDRSFGPYTHGPPFTFTPFPLSQSQALRAKDLEEMFPIIDLKAKPTTKPKIFVSLLWKQLNHLGNAGFDPATFRVDQYGNVLYYHADPASPLAWNIDHWFPVSRGGLTVPSNLRILQWQVCKKKHNKLEFLIPWWDLQVGISINQFLSVFASSNSDFRHRAFSLLFSDGECEELNDSQTVESHIFPQHYIESKEHVGLAPAAVVLSRKESYETSTLKSLDANRRSPSNTPIIASRKLKSNMSRENENPNMVTNPYQAIVMARNSFKQHEETKKMQGEIERLDDEVKDLTQKNDEEKLTIQELELVLIKRRRQAEKCRRLAEAQSSYRAILEKMIRDTMHQSIIYKEQVRLNQAASNALMARLEAQKAICDSSERELHRKFKHRDELESLVRPEWEQARKRSRTNEEFFSQEKDDKTVLYLPGNKPNTSLNMKLNESPLQDINGNSVLCLSGITKSESLSHKELRKRSRTNEEFFSQEKDDKTVLYLPGNKPNTSLNKKLNESPLQDINGNSVLCLSGITKSESLSHKELREFLEEEQKASEAGASSINEEEAKEHQETEEEKEDVNKAMVALEDGEPIDRKLQKLEIEKEGKKICDIQCPVHPELEGEEEEDEESRKQRGKGNIKKWLQILLLDDLQEENSDPNIQNEDKIVSRSDEIIRQLNMKYPIKVLKTPRFPESINTESANQIGVRKQQEPHGKKDIVNTEARKMHLNTHQQLITATGRAVDVRKGEDVEVKNTHMQNPPPYQLFPRKDCSNEANFGGEVTGRKSTSYEKKDKGIARSESFSKSFRRSPSSPSIILGGMRKGVDCMRKDCSNEANFGGEVTGRKSTSYEKKDKGIARSESFSKSFRRSPSSSSIILGGMRKGVDCMRKKPMVIGDEVDENAGNKFFLKSSIKSIKKAVKI